MGKLIFNFENIYEIRKKRAFRFFSIPFIFVLTFMEQLPVYGSDCRGTTEECKRKEDDLNTALSTLLAGAIIGATAIGSSIWNTTRKRNERSAYLLENNKSIRKALTLGHGDALEDLLKFYHISPSQRESAIQELKDHRVELLDHLRPDQLTPEGTRDADRYLRSVVFKKK